MTSGAHASAREIVEQLKAHRHPYVSWADVEDRFTAIVEAYGQAVERETRRTLTPYLRHLSGCAITLLEDAIHEDKASIHSTRPECTCGLEAAIRGEGA